MRHSFATWMLEEGADLRYVRDQMGHASIEEMASTYGHLDRLRISNYRIRFRVHSDAYARWREKHCRRRAQRRTRGGL